MFQTRYEVPRVCFEIVQHIANFRFLLLRFRQSFPEFFIALGLLYYYMYAIASANGTEYKSVHNKHSTTRKSYTVKVVSQLNLKFDAGVKVSQKQFKEAFRNVSHAYT